MRIDIDQPSSHPLFDRAAANGAAQALGMCEGAGLPTVADRRRRHPKRHPLTLAARIDIPGRDIVVCCDGTNNTLTGGVEDTNVLLLYGYLLGKVDHRKDRALLRPRRGHAGRRSADRSDRPDQAQGRSHRRPRLGARRIRQHRRCLPLPDEQLAAAGRPDLLLRLLARRVHGALRGPGWSTCSASSDPSTRPCCRR